MFALRVAALDLFFALAILIPTHPAAPAAPSPAPGITTDIPASLAQEVPPPVLESSAALREPDPGSPARPLLKPAIAVMDGAIERIISVEGALDAPMMTSEFAKLASLTRKSTPESLWDGSFLVPLNGPVTTPFGAHRSYGGVAESPHLGIDLAGPPGAGVLASNAGTVVFAGQFDVRGYAVLLDHGQAVYTGYYHLAMPTVETGQSVKKGEVIGAVGATGLATGPHVHWDLIVRGVHVSPFGLVDPQDVPAMAGPWPMVDLPPDVLAAQFRHITFIEVLEAISERESLVRDLYHSLLGRDPSEVRDEEVRLWANSDLSPDALPAAILEAGMPERTAAVRKLYHAFLGWQPEAPDDPGLLSWVESDLIIEEVRAGILVNGIDDRLTAIRRLYVNVLGRDPVGQDAGLKTWVEGGMALDEIAAALAASPEATKSPSAP